MSGAQRALAKLRKAVYAEETLNSLLCDAARTAKPGKAARGAQYSKDQRTWANTLIRDKLHKCAAVFASSVRESDLKALESEGEAPNLAYLLDPLRKATSAFTQRSTPTPADLQVVPAKSAAASSSSRGPEPPPLHLELAALPVPSVVEADAMNAAADGAAQCVQSKSYYHTPQ
eukprot:s5_g20.t1